jgi:hypothetical protein
VRASRANAAGAGGPGGGRGGGAGAGAGAGGDSAGEVRGRLIRHVQGAQGGRAKARGPELDDLLQ